MKAFSLILLLALVALPGNPLWGQGRPNPSPGSASSPQNLEAGMGATSSPLESQTMLQGLDRIFDPEQDYFDSDSGSFFWKGRTFNVGSSRVFRSRFERYLSLGEIDLDENERYQEIMQEVMQLLSPLNLGRVRNKSDSIDRAYQLLYEASEFSIDGNNSRILATRIYNSWRLRDEIRGVQTNRINLERNLTSKQREILNDLIMQGFRATRTRLGSGDEEEEMEEMTAHVQKQAFLQSDLAQISAMIGARELEQVVIAEQARLQFQTLIVSLLAQRRFQHALIASNFYREIFRASAQELEVGHDDLQLILPSSDLAHTIESMEFIANEAVVEVSESMRAVENAYRIGDKVLALERLQEIFHLGEYLAPVMLFEYSKRQDLMDIYRLMRRASRLADAKDWNGVERAVNQLMEKTDDFPGEEVFAAINAGRNASNLQLLRARQAMGESNTEQMEASLRSAMDIWPLNPDLENFRMTGAESIDREGQARAFFDQAMQEGRYRAIAERAAELGVAFIRDSQRTIQLREVVEMMTRIDIAIRQSDEMVRQDNPYGAWEILLEARALNQEDAVLNRQMLEISPRASRFAEALRRAEEHEGNQYWSQSLAWYLEVERLYPASRLANQAIPRLARQMMESVAENNP